MPFCGFHSYHYHYYYSIRSSPLEHYNFVGMMNRKGRDDVYEPLLISITADMHARYRILIWTRQGNLECFLSMEGLGSSGPLSSSLTRGSSSYFANSQLQSSQPQLAPSSPQPGSHPLNSSGGSKIQQKLSKLKSDQLPSDVKAIIKGPSAAHTFTRPLTTRVDRRFLDKLLEFRKSKDKDVLFTLEYVKHNEQMKEKLLEFESYDPLVVK